MLTKIRDYFVILKAFLRAKKEINMKAGWKTTEFWLSILTAVGTLWVAFNGMIDPALAVKIIGIIAGVYSIARTIVKMTPNSADDAILDKIEAILKDKGLLK